MRQVAAALITTVITSTTLAQPETGIGYPSIQDAVRALRTDPEARGGLRNGWYVILVDKGINEGIWALSRSLLNRDR